MGTQGPHCSLNNFILQRLDILNADAAQCATVCRFFAHPEGNICIYGNEFRFLHLKALARPRQCEYVHKELSEENLKHFESELKALRAQLTAETQE